MSLIPDPQDPRDHLLRVPPATAYRAPSEIDLGRLCLPVGDQRDSRVCTAAAVVDGCEMFVQQELSWQENYDAGRALFLAEGGDPTSSGSSLRYALRAAHRTGMGGLRLDSYARIAASGGERVRAMRWALARGLPVVISLQVGERFAGVGNMIYQPLGPGNSFAYNHAVLVVGYGGMLPEWFRARNSYGPQWGDRGYCRMDVGVAVRDALDVWVIQGFAEKSFVRDDANRRSEAWEWCELHVPDVRAWVEARMSEPQQIIDKCVEIGASPADLERWMGWQAGEVLTYAQGDTIGKTLDWGQWL